MFQRALVGKKALYCTTHLNTGDFREFVMPLLMAQ